MDYPEHKPINPSMIARSRQLRRAMTPMESRLWAVISDRSLNGLKFRRQFVVGSYVVDFACVAAKLVIEVDGDSHDGDTVNDGIRAKYLEQVGYRVIRFMNQDVQDNLQGVCEAIMAACGSSRKGS
jgi:very-short-patch-repair endonuclease